MKDEITYLRADRDKQFAAKDQQIEKLQKLLDQSQQLQLMTAQKLKQLEKPKNERESDFKEKDEQIHARASEVPKAAENSADKPVTFWQRLFGEQNNK
ncbi:replication protein B [Lacticaseibacillus casei 21/1]|nr:replication protein B [Lacticaseibacillus casei 21/1]